MIPIGISYSASGTAYVRRCLAAGVMPGDLPGGPDGNEKSFLDHFNEVKNTFSNMTRTDMLKELGQTESTLKELPPFLQKMVEKLVSDAIVEQAARDSTKQIGTRIDIKV
jgi:hypothetical protein